MLKPFQSVRSKMVLSYLAVVLVIALLFGSILYLFFSHQYSKEIRINNQLSLKSTVNTIESLRYPEGESGLSVPGTR